MLETSEVLWLLLAALGLGVALPVMIQLFFTLRQIRLTTARLTDQVEPSLRLINEMAQRQREPQPGGAQLASVVATLIPALMAAWRAFRQHQDTDDSGSDSDADSTAIENLEKSQ